MVTSLSYNYWYTEYTSLVSHLFVTLSILLILWFLAANLKSERTLFENASQYECGFEPFGSNFEFNIQYFIISILYLIFDIELALLLPWILYITLIPYHGTFIMIWFLLLFVIGLMYEWKQGILHWS